MTRLARLESRTNVPPLPKLVFKLDDREHAGEVTGYRLGNVTILRLATETNQHALDRAFALQPNAASAAALYGPQAVPECGQHWTASGAFSGAPSGPDSHSNPKRG